MMKTAIEQLSTYKSVHLNKRNIYTHFVGVPAIIWSIALLMSLASTSIVMLEQSFRVSFAMLFFAVTLIYYIKLHWRLSIGLFLFVVPVVYTTHQVALMEQAYLIAISVFVLGWIIQFIGHIFEKAKPAFFDDINQLLIGPFFLMAEIYFLLGLEKELEKTITPMAIEKRRALKKR